MSDRQYRLSKGRNRGFRRPKAEASSSASVGESSCDQSRESSSGQAQVIAVSRAISQGVPPSNGREQLTIETSDATHNACNQSRGESTKAARPNCYQCKYRGEIPGNAHSKCLHPKVAEITNDPLCQLVGLLGSRGIAALGVNLGRDEVLNPGKNPLGISGHQHGIKCGWFNWPINFDPTWLLTCDGFEEAPNAH